MTPFRSEKNTNWEGAFRVPLMVRWPGKIPAGVVSNEIVQHHDWLPTFLAAAGEPDVVEKLKQGHEAAGKTFKVHIDGYNLLPYLTGEEEQSPRQGFIYFSDDGDLVALRFDNWKLVFMEQRARGTLELWAEPFVPLRVPKLFNLRTDPFERADMTSNTYWDWYMSKAYMIMAAQAIVGRVPGDVRGVPAPPEGGELHDRPGAREDGRTPRAGREADARASRSWRDTPTREALVAFAEAAAQSVPPEERVAVFDNDGTLWCEKPMPIELGFILQRLAEMAEQDESLREQQPWKAAYEKDYAWLGGVIEKHYARRRQRREGADGRDPAGVRRADGGRVRARPAASFLDEAHHPTLGRRLRGLRLPADGRAAALPRGQRLHVLHRLRRRPRLHAAGRGRALRHPAGARDRQLERARATDDEHGGALTYLAEPDVFDDGPVKPVRIWSRIGRRPIVAGGNSNGDVPMLRFAGGNGRPALRLLVLHDDAEREFDYVKGAETALERAPDGGLDGRQRQGRLGGSVLGAVTAASSDGLIPFG